MASNAELAQANLILARENITLREEVVQYRAERDRARELATQLEADSDDVAELGSDYACWCDWEDIQSDIPCTHNPEQAKLYEGQPSLDDLLREAAEDAAPG